MDKFHSVDKKMGHHCEYLYTFFTLHFNCEYKNNDGLLISWVLKNNIDIHTGSTVKELIDLLKKFIKEYDLKSHSDKCFYKDQVLIYTDNVAKIYGFTQKYASDEFPNKTVEIQSFNLLEYFVVCSYTSWVDKDCDDIYKEMKYTMETKFIPNKRVFLTPYQYSRKIDKKAKNKCIVPKSIPEFKYWFEAYYGGCTYIDNKGVYENLIEYDRKSAYLYEYFMPHMSGKLKKVDTNNWKQWIDFNKITNSIGTYQIKFKMKHKFINVYTDKKFDFNVEYDQKFRFLNTDLKIFLQCVELIDIKCLDLFEYEVSNLPTSYIQHVANDFINKETYQDSLHKIIANSNYGSLCMHPSLNDLEAIHDKVNALNIDPYYCPMWGIEIASYARQHLFECGIKLKGWLYSDTDSIFCLNTVENIDVFNEYNNHMQKVIKIACEMFDLDFDKLYKLGLFIKKHEIERMVIRGIKTYAFITADKFVAAAAGSNDSNSIEDWFDLDKKLNYGQKVVKHLTDHSYFEDSVNMNLESNSMSSYATLIYNLLKS